MASNVLHRQRRSHLCACIHDGTRTRIANIHWPPGQARQARMICINNLAAQAAVSPAPRPERETRERPVVGLWMASPRAIHRPILRSASCFAFGLPPHATSIEPIPTAAPPKASIFGFAGGVRALNRAAPNGRTSQIQAKDWPQGRPARRGVLVVHRRPRKGRREQMRKG